MSEYLEHLRTALQATTIHSQTRYSWFGRSSSRLSAKLQQSLAPKDARNYLLYDLASELYSHFYICGAATPSNIVGGYVQQTGLTPFVARLSDANSGKGCWENGWRVNAVDKDGITVVRRGLSVRARAQDCAVEKQPRSPDAPASIRLPKEYLGMSPSFYMVLGDKALDHDDEQSLLRIYWNMSAQGAVAFVRNASILLNATGLAFRLKVLSDPMLFTRCDAGVIYIRRGDYGAAARVFRLLYAEIREYLKPGTPVFTKRLAWGVALAEDPGQGESFGQSRCRLLADALIRAYELGKKELDDKLGVISERFHDEGLDLQTPFLSAGSNDHYPTFGGSLSALPYTQARRDHAPQRPQSDSLLKTADEIGRRLVREAVWDGDQCNWMGAAPAASRHEALAYRALGTDLYTGTSGVALFLAELCVASSNSEARRTALGGIRQSLGQCAALTSRNRLGFYTGGLGVVFSAARIGNLLAEQDLVKQAAKLLRACTQDLQDHREPDLLSGDAGAIVALLLLRQMLCDANLLDLARRLGDGLLETADRLGGGYSWKSPKFAYHRNLTGLSHGASGIGFALLELFHVTGDIRYREAGEGAFQYERAWFSAEEGNWPDFREGTRRKSSRARLNFATYWCHGAPGIGLSRLRSYEILRNPTDKLEASIAANTTYQVIQKEMQERNFNLSLCHGLAGNIELLLYAREVLGEEWLERSQLAWEVAEAGLDASRRNNGVWTCGVPQGETPSLMTGLAGIGYFYLRLSLPAIPSILMTRSVDFGVPPILKSLSER